MRTIKLSDYKLGDIIDYGSTFETGKPQTWYTKKTNNGWTFRIVYDDLFDRIDGEYTKKSIKKIITDNEHRSHNTSILKRIQRYTNYSDSTMKKYIRQD